MMPHEDVHQVNTVGFIEGIHTLRVVPVTARIIIRAGPLCEL
jgi:hypothetical protein